MNMSIYIPRISKLYNQENIIEEFNFNNIGIVNRVDFVPIEPKLGSIDDPIPKSFRSAFVHFSAYYYHDYAFEFYNRLFVDNKSLKFYPILTSNSYNDSVNNQEYWLLLKANHPVEETNLNIHQVVENARVLKDQVDEQEDRLLILKEQVHDAYVLIRKLSKTVAMLTDKLENTKNDIHDTIDHNNYNNAQLTDDYYNNETEKTAFSTINALREELYGIVNF